VPLIRINPRDCAGATNVIPLADTALTVLRELEARMAG